MSPLTKLFVVLLVITSILTTAGFIVFVNAQQPLETQIEQSKAAVDSAMAQAAQSDAARDNSMTEYRLEAAQHESDRTKDAAAITTLQSQLNESQVTIAQLRAQSTNLQSTVNTMTSSQSLTTATADKLQDQVTTLRANNDNLVKRSEEDSRHIFDLSSSLETSVAKLNEVTEKLKAEQDNNQKLTGFLADHGYHPDDIVATAGPVGPGAPAISGMVSEKSVINGNTYATISVGSADGVSKGMQFYVVDKDSGNFLAILTVDTVDSNDAIGRLQGDPDKVAQVRNGNDVKTQLRGQ